MSKKDKDEDDESGEENDGNTVMYFKLNSGEELVALVADVMSMTPFGKDSSTTWMLAYPMEVVNMQLHGQQNVLFRPWINTAIVKPGRMVPIRGEGVLTHVELSGQIKNNFLQYVASKQLEKHVKEGMKATKH